MSDSIRQSKKLSYKELIHLISIENTVSEAAVHTTLRGLARVMLREMANGKVINLLNIGIFFSKEKKVRVRNLLPDHPEQTFLTINPKFRASVQFCHRLQYLTGHKIANKHQRREILNAIRQNPIGELQLYHDFIPIDKPDSTPQ